MTDISSNAGPKPVSLHAFRAARQPLRNVNQEHKESLSTLDRLAVWITASACRSRLTTAASTRSRSITSRGVP